MHRPLIGIGALALLAWQGPHLLDVVHTTVAPVRAHRMAPDAAARALLGSTVDATAAAGRRGRIDESLNAFSSGVERRTGITDRDADVITNAARSPAAQGVLRQFVDTLKHPPSEGIAALPHGGGSASGPDLMETIGRTIHDALPH